MTPLGIADLNNDPEGGAPPSQSLFDRFVPSGMPFIDDPSAVSSEEKDLAVQDTQCRQSSGYTEALYTAEWALASQFVVEHQDELNAGKAQMDKQAELHRQRLSGNP
ncbi:hypothetical protein [Actinomyces vulturis]|uniref:hypothetical protein n=1 Tax=Actinomyces vulturis TaxID=1857645 RepID=UPI0008339563|nr:hypothetical protein [Actinomyces vulturis]